MTKIVHSTMAHPDAVVLGFPAALQCCHAASFRLPVPNEKASPQRGLSKVNDYWATPTGRTLEPRVARSAVSAKKLWS